MVVLYSYPQLFGLPDNNPFGLKVDSFLRLAQIPYQHEHILDTKNAPRGQLPYLVDGDKTVTDSNRIISYLTEQYKILLDENITDDQKKRTFWLHECLIAICTGLFLIPVGKMNDFGLYLRWNF